LRKKTDVYHYEFVPNIPAAVCGNVQQIKQQITKKITFDFLYI